MNVKASNSEHVVEMRLCEQSHVILKADILYRFTVDKNCKDCLALALTYVSK